jgi:hypothetical protein
MDTHVSEPALRAVILSKDLFPKITKCQHGKKIRDFSARKLKECFSEEIIIQAVYGHILPFYTTAELLIISMTPQDVNLIKVITNNYGKGFVENLKERNSPILSELAARHGYLHFLHWLEDRRIYLSPRLLREASLSGHLPILEWYHSVIDRKKSEK